MLNLYPHGKIRPLNVRRHTHCGVFRNAPSRDITGKSGPQIDESDCRNLESYILVNANFSMCGLYSFLETVLPRAEVGDSDTSTQTVTVVASNIRDERKQILEDTQGACEDAVAQSSQQGVAVSEMTSANENENVKEATPGGNGNDLNLSHAGHTTPDTPEVTKETEEIKRAVVTKTGTEIVEDSSTLHEKNSAFDGQGNSSGGGVTDGYNTIQAVAEDLITNADTGHSEIPVLNNQIDVSGQFDEILEDLERTARTENVVFEERWQKFFQQVEEEAKEESKETNKNLGRPDTIVEGGNVDEISGGKLEANTSSNERQTVKGNSESGTATALNAQGNMNNTQEACKENKDEIKCEESDATRSTSENLKKNDKVCFSDLNGSNLSVLILEPRHFFRVLVALLVQVYLTGRGRVDVSQARP